MVAIVVLVLITEAVEALEAIVVLTLCLGALSFALAQTLMLLDKDTGTSRMQEVAGFIYQGAQGFFKTQYTAIGALPQLCPWYCSLDFYTDQSQRVTPA